VESSETSLRIRERVSFISSFLSLSGIECLMCASKSMNVIYKNGSNQLRKTGELLGDSKLRFLSESGVVVD